MMRWEYRDLCLDLPVSMDAIGELGSEGWELAGIVQATEGYHALAIFKRPIAEEPRLPQVMSTYTSRMPTPYEFESLIRDTSLGGR